MNRLVSSTGASMLRAGIWATPMRQSLRLCSTIPTEEEVLKAYKVLGVSTSGSFADVKKKYVDLAKEHHPDIATSSASNATNRMVDINHAYNTVNRFHKAGRKLSSAHTTPGSSSSHTSSYGMGGGASHWKAGAQQSYYTAQDRGYQPWHEDLDPLLYEMMWEELRRQNDRDAFERAMHPDEFYDFDSEEMPPGFGGGSYRPRRQQQSKQRGKTDSGNGPTGNAGGKEKVKTTTWPEADLQALVNMYQDGKSFEFIGNALGKDVAKVVEEFNRWSDDSKHNRRQHNRHRGSNNNQAPGNKYRRNSKRRGPGKGPYYHMEYPTGPPYGFYDFMVDEDDYFDEGADAEGSDPYGYYTGDDYGYYGDPWQAAEEGATPFTGGHHMSGGPTPGTAHTHRGASGGQHPKHANGNTAASGSHNTGGNPSGQKKKHKSFWNNHNHRTFKTRNRKA